MSPEPSVDDAPLEVRTVARPGIVGPADRLLFLIHGYGQPPEDLAAHVEGLDPDGRFTVVTPVAPLRKAGAPIWHRALFGESEEAPQQYRSSLAALQRAYRDVLTAGGFDPAEAVVGGFSQGAGLAVGLVLSPHGSPVPAGCLAFCGFLPPVAGLPVDERRADGCPLFLSAATDDRFLPLDGSRQSAAAFAALGFSVRYHELPGDHDISPDAVGHAADWLDDVAAGSATPATPAKPATPAGTGEAPPLGEPVPTDVGGLLDVARSLWIGPGDAPAQATGGQQ